MIDHTHCNVFQAYSLQSENKVVFLCRIKPLMYGPPQKHQRKTRQKGDQLKQIQQMRKLYQLYHTTGRLSRNRNQTVYKK